MNLKTQWHLRQMARALLTAPLSVTFAVLTMGAIRSYQFYKYGLAMYPQYTFPKNHTMHDELFVLWTLSLSPLVPWLLAALPIDIVVRRFGWKVYE